MTELTPYKFADAVFYRLGKKINKPELGVTLKSCKTLLTLFNSQEFEDYEILQFIDTLCREMRKNELPLVFRMFYTLAYSFLTNKSYQLDQDRSATKYASWIRNEIERVKNI